MHRIKNLVIANVINVVFTLSFASASEADRWIADERSGCKVWNEHPREFESMEWSGGCSNGHADKNGTLLWYQNGNQNGKYVGEMRDGRTHGKGLYECRNGDRYEGDFVEGKKSGFGILVMANGDRYQGNFLDNRFSGMGVLEYANTVQYESNLSDARCSAGLERVRVYSIRGRNTGDFIACNMAGTIAGKGVKMDVYGKRYEGIFVDGKANGKGDLILVNGSNYEGDFVDGKITGKGVLTDAKGKRYEGDFVDGNRTGRGVLIDDLGNRYEGGFLNNLFEGIGVITLLNKSHFEGEFKKGKVYNMFGY
jgi:hypothetical protein